MEITIKAETFYQALEELTGWNKEIIEWRKQNLEVRILIIIKTK